MRGMWTNSEEILVKEINLGSKIIRAYIAMFDNRDRIGSMPLVLEDGRVLRKYWVARCTVSLPNLGVTFESFGNNGMATKKEATTLAKNMVASVS